MHRGPQMRRRFSVSEQRGDIGGGLQPGEDGAEVTRAAAIERQPRQRPRHVGHALERPPQFFAQTRIGDQVRDTVEPRIDRVRIGQRRHQPFGELASAAAGHGAVDRLDQAALPFARQRAHQLEAGPRRRVDEHPRAVAFALGPAQRRPLGDLGLLDIGDRRRCCCQFRPRETAEPVERADLEEPGDPAFRRGAVKQHRRLWCSHPAELVDQRPKLRVVEHVVGQDQLARLHPRNVGQQPRQPAFADMERPGGNVDPGQPVLRFAGTLDPRQGHQEVRLRRVEQFLLGERARRDQPGHVAPHHRFRAAFLGFRRILGLLADRDPEPERDQLLQIIVGRMHRHAAHRDILAQVLAALGQRDAERPRRVHRVLEEQLVEIPHPVEQKRIRVVRLDLDELLHHRRRRCPAFRRGKLGGRQDGRAKRGFGVQVEMPVLGFQLFAM
jgi:hypothetical protein